MIEQFDFQEDNNRINLYPYHAYIVPEELNIEGVYNNSSKTNNSKSFIPISNNNTTNIQLREDEKQNTSIYDLSGMKKQNTHKGEIYIMKGHKIIIR